jgi:hypothetical protein
MARTSVLWISNGTAETVPTPRSPAEKSNGDSSRYSGPVRAGCVLLPAARTG